MGFKLLPPPKDACQECAVKHDPRQPHNAQSMFYLYRFYSKRGRWPTWKDALDHCASQVQADWERILRKEGAWTEPKSEAPDVCPMEDGTIGTVQIIPIEHKRPKGRGKKKRS